MEKIKLEATDPVCGMKVNQATALHSEHNGKMFYFCGEHCLQKFLANPDDSKPMEKSGGCCG
ncbi:MAG: hypothetical protein B7Y39_04480 [Bdellovibrio sp. 28-41-41]|nr:MAG: hypothetical protein B7Y39_04480 [Bdellovibrio sp. 28-41-41]